MQIKTHKNQKTLQNYLCISVRPYSVVKIIIVLSYLSMNSIRFLTISESPWIEDSFRQVNRSCFKLSKIVILVWILE